MLISGCKTSMVSPGQAKPVLAQAKRGSLEAKLRLYLDLTDAVRDEWGFVARCDSLLFTSLSVCAGHTAVLRIAEDHGRWYRRPRHDCYENELYARSGPGSHSDISKDQLLGLLWATWCIGDKFRLSRLIAYGKASNWKVGRGPISSTYVTPPLRNTIAEMSFRLGGDNHQIMRSYPMSWPSGLGGYRAHLQVLHILLRKKVTGSITAKMLSRIKEHYARSPKNALFSFAYHCFQDKDFNATADLLLKEDWFPEKRLPASRDRCTNYMWERDSGDDWKPCNDKRTHDGVDFLFVASLLLDEAR